MKLPNKVIICGREFKVIIDNKKSGGSFTFSTCTIVIGGLYKQDMLTAFMHEVIEAILAERGMRYGLYAENYNKDYLFSFNHQEFENVVNDIALALKDILKDSK